MNSNHENDRRIIWLNGRILPAGEATISPFDRGFLYGDGLFETMRAENGVVLYLSEHLKRIRESAESLRIRWNFRLDWSSVFKELLHRNMLQEDAAAAKIVLTRGAAQGMMLSDVEHPTLCLSVQRYHPPEDSSYATGWSLTFFREGYAPPLARYKTLNYLYYLTARQHAIDAGYDEAIIIGAQGRVCETAAGSLLVKINGQWWRPAAGYKLKGTAVASVSELLEELGEPVGDRDLTPDEVAQADTVWVCNSLVGVMPVREIDGRPIGSPSVKQASRVRAAFFFRGRISV